MGKRKQVVVLMVMVMAIFMTMGGQAWADGNNGPTPPAVGDPIAGNTSPHGGYSPLTDYCLQCHNLHSSGQEYALLNQTTITAVCSTCHSTYTNAPTGALDPGFPSTEGTASSRAVYQLDAPGAAESEHGIGKDNTNGTGDSVTMYVGGWSYGWRSSGRPTPATWPDQTTGNASDPASAEPGANGGLNCASCHTPHGGPPFGQAINTRWILRSDIATHNQANVTRYAVVQDEQVFAYSWAVGTDGRGAFAGNSVGSYYLNNNAGTWQLCTAAAGGGTCNDWVMRDQEGQAVYAYGYKLLSANPNATWAQPRSWGADYRMADQPGWCGRCHPNKVDSSAGAGQYGASTSHAHPTGCTYCHGNPTAAATKDFPHQGDYGALLKDYPDGLCVNTCHTGGLP